MKKFTAFLLCAALAVTSAGCGFAQKKNSVVGFYMDTVVTLTGYCEEAVLKEALILCGEYERLLSRTIEGSDIWNINHSGGKPVKISGETAEILELALEVCEKSEGALDITIAPAVDLWDFKSGEPILPKDTDIADAMQHVDYTQILLSEDTVTVPEGMEIDLGAVAKGYIADKVAAYLVDSKVESAVLNFGGNVVAIGDKPDGSGWTIGVQDPAEPTGEYLMLLDVRGCSVVTSGVYQRGFDLDGVRYHHILDTATGWPVWNGVVSATVIAGESALADALSTACFAMGSEGIAFAESMGAEAIIIFEDGSVEYTDGAQKMLIKRKL